jgi:hypothetical protein
VKFYGHHAIQIPLSSQPAVEYHQYVLTSDAPRDSFENFQSACKHVRNAQDIGYRWATERKDALWEYTNADKTQTSPDIPVSSNNVVVPSTRTQATYAITGPMEVDHKYNTRNAYRKRQA